MRKVLAVVAMVGFLLGVASVAKAEPGDATRRFVRDEICGEHWVGNTMIVGVDCRQTRENVEETVDFVRHTACRAHWLDEDTLLLDVDCRQTRENVEETEAYVVDLLDDTVPDLHELP